MALPLMPMATAVWLVDNTTLTFKQIAGLCGLHELEVQGIADETVGFNIVGLDPTLNSQLTRDEIARCQADPTAELQLLEDEVPAKLRTKGPRYTPVSKRQDKPDAIAWLLRNHPEISDAQVSKLIGTTKPTIQAIRDRSHWNIQNIKPLDPVALGLSTQIDLDEIVLKAAKRVAAQVAKEEKAAAKAAKAKVAKEAAATKEDVAQEASAETPAETPLDAVAEVSGEATEVAAVAEAETASEAEETPAEPVTEPVAETSAEPATEVATEVDAGDDAGDGAAPEVDAEAEESEAITAG
ncbi:MAG: DUF1013 domain-containing protein [Proteobacteria bacterium]|nr:DUF1013 domain-containing protein [Pseudomonadota bacterium]